jgi:hypothetical protein
MAKPVSHITDVGIPLRVAPPIMRLRWLNIKRHCLHVTRKAGSCSTASYPPPDGGTTSSSLEER